MKSEFDADRTRSAIVREGLALLAHGLLLPLSGVAAGGRGDRRADQHTLVFIHGLGAGRAGFLPLRSWLRLHGSWRQLAFGYQSRGSIEAIALRL